MSDEQKTKEVYYDEWCTKCKNWPVSDGDEPCNECLATPFNLNSHKPVRFKDGSDES